MAAPKRVMVLSLDGGALAVLRPLAERGAMPFIGRMLAGGACEPLPSTAPPVTAPAWTSYLTAVLPPRHGTYDFQTFDRDTWRLTFLPDTGAPPTAWEHMAGQGAPYICVGVPMMYPPPSHSGGTVVCGFDAPSLDVAFSPPELREVAAPDYKLALMRSTHRRDRDFVDAAAHVEEVRARLSADLAGERPWQVLHHHVQSTDTLQHRLWHKVEDMLAGRDDLVEAFYRRVDAAVEGLYESCRPDFCVLLSDHGFRRLNKAITLNRWLLDAGYLKWGRKPHPVGSLLSLARRLDVLNLRRLLFARKSLWTKLLRTANLARFDIEHSVALMANGSCMGHLFLAPGASAAEVKRMLERIGALKDPENGVRPVRSIMSHQDVYGVAPGRFGPDYFLIPEPGYQFCDAALFPQWLRAIRPGDKRFGTGGHEQNGVFAAIESEGQRLELVRRPHLVDVFPTVLHLAGLSAMAGVDGRSCIELDDGGRLEIREAARREETGVPAGVERYDQGDQQKVKDRLQGLGYL